MRKRRESTTTQIIHLLGNPALTHAQIARSLGISAKTVQRVAKSAKPDLDEAESKIALYQKLLRKKLPIEDRVSLMQKIAKRAETNPFAAMRALERADALDGIVTAKDELGRRGEDQHRVIAPLFALPEGTNLALQIGIIKPPEMTVAGKRLDEDTPD